MKKARITNQTFCCLSLDGIVSHHPGGDSESLMHKATHAGLHWTFPRLCQEGWPSGPRSLPLAFDELDIAQTNGLDQELETKAKKKKKK